ncbi:hypothetical protein DICSQDRAFT_173220 [Dichomitus squalens LYAD-421 SS1]|uniref:Uncharacterized protein n=1 Tax=Dichomitus squalens (strain LYAD-421) TaxID=732165 RepID=R7SPV5_DICSQ|nr:uncharacterized protein DICSQDRAFT_173220 [Dichomitus squalens LYAD-421 SS1]EJF58126.1 hypothetical protein DICSQDRAFT_173220 [Dichomitus squalens LYAD-421 SS1]
MPAQSPLHHSGKPTFASILLLDGTAYFLMLLILNLLHVAFTVSAVADVSSGPTSVIGTFEQPFTSLLIGRFLISLQKVQRRLCDSTRSISLGDFASQWQGSRNTGDFIGALGAQPSFHEDHEEAEESDSL